MNKYRNVIVTGSMSWDIIMDFPKKFADYFQPDMLHQINVSFVLNKLEKQLGGTATNIAYALSQTMKAKGIKNAPVHILGALGKDNRDHLAFFKKNNIRTEGIIRDPDKYNAYGSVITDIRDNQIWGYYYGACEAGKNAPLNRFAKKTSLMIISANHPDAFLAAQRHAIKEDIGYVYDVGMAMSWIKDEDLRQGVKNAHILIGNDYEIALILKTLKTTAEAITGTGTILITTLGERGVTARIGNKTYTAAAAPADKVIDPTGAGDAWRGGFMASYLAGVPFEDCLRTGNAVASFAIESYGTVNYKISKKQLDARIRAVR